MPSFSCGQCSACKYRTKNPKTDCKFGSKCTRKDCMYAHASPAGTEHMAGSVATACRSGILCSAGGCKFAHPSKSLVCTAKFEAPAVLRLSGSLQHQKECLGEYTLTERVAYGRPVWKHASEDRWIARHSDGDWCVQYGERVGKEEIREGIRGAFRWYMVFYRVLLFAWIAINILSTINIYTGSKPVYERTSSHGANLVLQTLSNVFGAAQVRIRENLSRPGQSENIHKFRITTQIF